jgi:predicted  nucleic acid-binding Zn-ribbon protein
MSHANATLRETSAASTARINTLTESLQITSSKVAESRADADMARAKVSSLGTQLKSLKCALDETKRTCESIRTEHDDIQSSSRTLEAKLVQTESELQRVDKEKFEMKLERDTLRHEVEDYTQTCKHLRLTLEKKEDEISKMKKNILEREDVERARIDRMNRLENELRDSRSMLVDVTSAAKDAESTNVDLQNTIQHLQRENKSSHAKIEEIMDSSRREKTKLQETLAEVESGAQKLRMKVTTDEEEMHRIKLDNLDSEKEITQLKNRISNLEGRLKDATSSAGVVSPKDQTFVLQHSKSSMSSATSASTSSSLYKTPGRSVNENYEPSSNLNINNKPRSSGSSKSSDNTFKIPPLRPVTPRTGYSKSKHQHAQGKENIFSMNKPKNMKKSFGGGINGPKLSSVKCSICGKNAYGMMKSCQCGNPSCDKRAHASCIAGKNPLPASVSHPGTPAPRLPCILCSERFEI